LTLRVSLNCVQWYSIPPTLDDWVGFTEAYLLRPVLPKEELPAESNRWFFLLSYLLSATLKDCSIIAKFAEGGSDVHFYLIDLDPKSATRLDKWLAQDQEIVDAFRSQLKHLEGIPLCIDDNFPLG